MVLSLGTAAYAAEAPALRLSAQYRNGQNIVEVRLSGDDVTNGVVTVNYDATQVYLISVTPGDSSWVVSTNSSVEGAVTFAWVGSHISAEATVVTLVFGAAGSYPYTSYTASLTELYCSGVKQYLPNPVIETITSPGNTSTGGGSGTAPSHPFTDIDGHWAEEDIIAAYRAGLFNGTGNGTTFSPNMALTRGMLVTLLYRMAGEPTVEGEHPFTDVADGLYYSKAAVWAYRNGIVNGTGNGTTFSPDMAITREQTVTMLYRYARSTGANTSLIINLALFTDADQLSDWAEEAMIWAVAERLITGTPDGKLLPGTNIDRAQAATILVRFLGL